jgi:FkbM family methyltransferase
MGGKLDPGGRDRVTKSMIINNDYCKSILIRTPLERPLIWVKQASARIRYRNRPEHRDLVLEANRIDQALRRLIGRRSNCIDVGCHIGSMLSFLTRLAPEGKHMAFEPIPQKVKWLRRKFPEVDVRQVALGETPGKLTFYESLSRSGFSGMRKTGDPQDVYHEFVVDCQRLDHYIEEGRPISFIKLDVEGAEFSVLRGAVELIRRDHPTLLFESVPGAVEKFGRTRREFFAFLTEDLNYFIFLAEDFLAGRGCLDWDRFDRAHYFPFKAMNYLAIPR